MAVTPAPSELAADIREIFRRMREAMTTTLPKDDDWYADNLAEAIEENGNNAINAAIDGVTGGLNFRLTSLEEKYNALLAALDSFAGASMESPVDTVLADAATALKDALPEPFPPPDNGGGS